ncbi:unnamed protein product [Linum tenue]|uniref:Uncharacterized protein n=1 Tax=Linum tenue TaxID=586396 RepID=A0AAV0GVK1_9ROSI|nr:unnamed protein product [Linum tenue]
MRSVMDEVIEVLEEMLIRRSSPFSVHFHISRSTIVVKDVKFQGHNNLLNKVTQKGGQDLIRLGSSGSPSIDRMAPSLKTRMGRCNRQGVVVEVPADDQGGCSTPKGRRFRIPEPLSCPPAPMKAKSAPKNCSSRVSSSTAAFFAPLEEELELFFLFAFRKI